MKEKKYSSGGMGLLGVLLVVFIVLKLVGVISWSWWVVLIPLWINLALIIIALLAVIAVAVVTRD